VPSPLASKWTKAFIFLLCFVPLGVLIWRALTANLGANPVEFIQHATGDWTLRFLVITLCITPFRKLLKLPDLIRFRRMLGLFAFFYACLHFLTYLGPDQSFDLAAMWKDVYKRPFITVGFAAFVLLIPLALTSTAGWIRPLILMNRCRLVPPRSHFAELQSPKPRRRRQKLHANPLPSFARLALIHHAALLLFQRLGVRQNEHLPVIDLVLHHQQTAVRVDHHGLARLLEFLPVVRAALRLQSHLVKRPPAATVGWRGCSVHTAIIGLFRKHRKLARRTGVPHKQPARRS
jgi:Ferric reductase like transmembrane component